MRSRVSLVRLLSVASLVLLALGCVRGVPTTQNASKFVREAPPLEDFEDVDYEEEAEEGGKLSASTGVTFQTQKTVDVADRESSLAALTTEGALTLYLAERYDLVFSVGNFLFNVDGNYWLLDDGTRLGLMHGAGIGYFGSETNVDGESFWTHRLLANLGGGLFWQASSAEDGTPFAALRYTFSALNINRVGELVPDLENNFRPTHYATGNLGLIIPAPNGSVSPELAVSYGWHPEQRINEFLVTLGVSFATAF
ncbi:MAG: hypothetical protein ABEN55_09015 [Bradymonadaceae bacterium]